MAARASPSGAVYPPTVGAGAATTAGKASLQPRNRKKAIRLGQSDCHVPWTTTSLRRRTPGSVLVKKAARTLVARTSRYSSGKFGFKSKSKIVRAYFSISLKILCNVECCIR
tara:strand:- start:75 stop:410 length:336 start_codon:yes stop_codon:yes gene_type:complete